MICLFPVLQMLLETSWFSVKPILELLSHDRFAHDFLYLKFRNSCEESNESIASLQFLNQDVFGAKTFVLNWVFLECRLVTKMTYQFAIFLFF